MSLFVRLGVATAALLCAASLATVERAHADLSPASDSYVGDLSADLAVRLLSARPARGAKSGRASIAALVSGVEPAKRAAATKLFTDTLALYRKFEQRVGARTNDAATALATFVAGNLAAYRHREVSDQEFAALTAQVRRGLRAQPATVRALQLDRNATLEQLAIMGMLMYTSHLSLAQQPDPKAASALETSAGNYLRQLLGADPRALNLTDAGLAADEPGTLTSLGRLVL